MVPLLPGTYGLDNDFRSLVLAVSTWDPDAVFTSGTAARLTWWPDIRPREVTAITNRRYRRHVQRTRLIRSSLHDDLIMDVGGLRVQHPAASTIDMVRELGADAIDEALRRRATTLSALHWALGLMPGRAGNTRIAECLGDSKDEPWSALERQAHALLRAAGMRGWRSNHRIRVPWGWVYADIAFLHERVIVELDGWEFHQSRKSFVSDRNRDVALQHLGWNVLRFTSDSVGDLISQLSAHLTSRRRVRHR